MALAALSKALGLNCLFQKAELESKLATPVRKSNESRNTQPEDQKKPGGDRNYAAAAKNKNQQAAALEATNRWDVAPAMSLCVALPASCSSCPTQPASPVSALLGHQSQVFPSWSLGLIVYVTLRNCLG